jgi:hypothetical protein
MTDTNELTGRELAVACARAMGWTVNKWDAWYDTEGHYSGTVEPEIDPREMLAWLHERGEVEIYSNARGASAALWLPDISRGPDDCKVGGTTPIVRGSNTTEALQRLVVAVAQRGSKEKP